MPALRSTGDFTVDHNFSDEELLLIIEAIEHYLVKIESKEKFKKMNHIYYCLLDVADV